MSGYFLLFSPKGLTSWRMSSSLGMMESSRVSSLQRQERVNPGATGSGGQGSSSRAQVGEGRRLAAHLFWIRPMTWEYVFPTTLSPFTFTSRSPRDKEWDHMSESKAGSGGYPWTTRQESEAGMEATPGPHVRVQSRGGGYPWTKHE